MNAILVFVMAYQQLVTTLWAILNALAERDTNLETRHFVKVDFTRRYFQQISLAPYNRLTDTLHKSNIFLTAATLLKAQGIL